MTGIFYSPFLFRSWNSAYIRPTTLCSSRVRLQEIKIKKGGSPDFHNLIPLLKSTIKPKVASLVKSMTFSGLGLLSLSWPSLNNFRFGGKDMEREWIHLLRRLRSLAILLEEIIIILRKHLSCSLNSVRY